MACVAKQRGRYVIDCYDQHGKRYRKTMQAGTTKDAVKKELREIEAIRVILQRGVCFRQSFPHIREIIIGLS